MIIALNNKSNLEKEEFNKYMNDLSEIKTNHTLILCPTYLNIPAYKESDVLLGAQNTSSKENGAYTGEISATQLKSYGVKYTIVGHSERRKYQKESVEEITQKTKLLLDNDIIPILCVGETLEEKQNNETESVINSQLLGTISNLTEEEKNKLIIAYEPVWSIGTGIIPTNEEIIKVINYIKEELPNSKLLYGGSVNEENVDTLKQIEIIDGYLLGGLSLKVDKLKELLNKCN